LFLKDNGINERLLKGPNLGFTVGRISNEACRISVLSQTFLKDNCMNEMITKEVRLGFYF
jgi:hypothetical protein